MLGVRHPGFMRARMAAEGDTRDEVTAHVKSYSHFASMMKWGTIISFVTAMIVVLIISS